MSVPRQRRSAELDSQNELESQKPAGVDLLKTRCDAPMNSGAQIQLANLRVIRMERTAMRPMNVPNSSRYVIDPSSAPRAEL
jgi:hypothetical protein